MGIKHRRFIHNMDKKGTRICMLAGEEVIVLIGIKEIYTGILENRLSIIVIKSISVDGASIPLVIIVPGRMIITSWFNRNIIGNKLVIISDSGYTNESICLI
jgi:hypothetical protein